MDSIPASGNKEGPPFMQRPSGFPLSDNRKNIEKQKNLKPSRFPLNTLKSKIVQEENKFGEEDDRVEERSDSQNEDDVIHNRNSIPFTQELNEL